MSNHPTPVFSDTPVIEKEQYGPTYRTDILHGIDWLGNEFRVGDLVMYCIGAGRGQQMALGHIQQMRAKETGYYDWKQVKSWIATGWDLEVQVLTEKVSGFGGPRTKPAWVNPMNITSVDGIVKVTD